VKGAAPPGDRTGERLDAEVLDGTGGRGALLHAWQMACKPDAARVEGSITMATVTRTTVEVTVGEYRYRAELDGNQLELFRDDVSAGSATWNGGKIEKFPDVLSEDARDALTAGIAHNLGKAWRGRSETFGEEVGPAGDPVLPSGAAKTEDAANHGQMGNEIGRPARQGEAEVGTGGPGRDPSTGELGGQALTPGRRASGDGFSKKASSDAR